MQTSGISYCFLYGTNGSVEQALIMIVFREIDFDFLVY